MLRRELGMPAEEVESLATEDLDVILNELADEDLAAAMLTAQAFHDPQGLWKRYSERGQDRKAVVRNSIAQMMQMMDLSRASLAGKPMDKAASARKARNFLMSEAAIDFVRRGRDG